MSFTLPFSDLVDSNMLTTLAGVTTANSFQVTLNPVGFPDPSGQTSPVDMQCIIHVGDDVEDPDPEVPLSHKSWKRPYAIQIFILKDPAVLKQTRFETWCNVVRAEVEKAIVADPFRGNYAQNTELHDPVTFADANDLQGVMIFATVTYRTLYDDPYNR